MGEKKTAYVTGGTGLLGSHLIARLVNEGYAVRALVRETSDTSFLETLGVDLVTGDITASSGVLAPGMHDATHVFHCAAFVDDWAPREELVRINVGGLRHVLEAAAATKPERFIFIGSCVSYGDRPHRNLDESAPFMVTGDNYNYTKIECERVLREFVRRTGLPTVILRPPYIYGPRDRQFFPRVLDALKNGTWAYVNGGTAPLTPVYVLNMVEACLLAAECSEALGEAFIITDDESISRRELIEILCEETGYEPPTKSYPLWVAKLLRPVYESVYRLCRAKTSPRINRHRLKFVSTHLTFDISKAKRVLGYAVKYPMRESLRDTARWFKENYPQRGPAK